MSNLLDIGVNLIATAIAFAFGWFANRLRDLWRFRKTRAFWRDFVTDDLKVVTSVFIQDEHYIWERSGLVGVGDVQALGELEKQLQKVGVRHLPITPSHQLTGAEHRGNLVLVGGPHSNEVTAEVMRRLPLTLRFGPAETHDANIYDADTNNVMEWVSDAGDRLVVDQGIVIRAANPFNAERSVVILAGSFGFGTSAAAQLLNRPELLTHRVVTAGRPFEAVFSVEIVRGTPQNIEIKDLKQLDPHILRTERG
ncbi:hypothetical protein AB0D94_10285 [Streptomyces sp. NPDC048255]|uniref:hypothetical protein n=1 Tax=Streptomyces TaxID=1883 RepID=UPI00340C9BD3